MSKRPQKHVQFFLDPRRRLSAFDNRRHHLMSVSAESRIGDDFHQAAEPEHVAPNRFRVLRLGAEPRLLSVAKSEHAPSQGCE